ncbi:MAG: phosphotransferase [Pseudomonadota bacterium]
MQNKKALSAEEVLKSANWLPVGSLVTSTAIAGAGNMNLVERVQLDNGDSLILKRARGWVEKYPDIPAPIERAGVEAAFYKSVAGTAAGKAMPNHLGYDEEQAANLLQDLGEGTDGMFVYDGTELPLDQLHAVADWAASLHGISVTAEMRDRFSNDAMRALNALHIFTFPLDPDNGFALDEITPGLQAVGDGLKLDAAFVAAVNEVDQRYLSQSTDSGAVLLHGDLYPGSWLTTDDGLFVIDPEFCWIGPAEWDVGVLLAHMKLSGQPAGYGDQFTARYGRPLDEDLMNKITGIEIMRRLIGVAQLPLSIDLATKKALLEKARNLVLGTTQ